MSCVRESKGKLKIFYRLFLTFLSYFIGPGTKRMFERALTLSLRIRKYFNDFQVLKWFSFLLRVTCISFTRATNTDVWRVIVSRAIESRETVARQLIRIF